MSLNNTIPNDVIKTIILIFDLVTLIPGLAVSTRRLHDTDRSGWWILISLTIIGIIPLIFWYATKGTEGGNRFGEDPLLNEVNP